MLNNAIVQEICSSVTDETTVAELDYKDLIKGTNNMRWINPVVNDLERLAQGIVSHMPTGTNNIFFIHHTKVPRHKIVTYAWMFTSISPNKLEVYRARTTVGGNHITYSGNTSTS